MAKQQVNLRLDEDVLAKVDARRGGLSRTAWVERAIEYVLRPAVAVTPSTAVADGVVAVPGDRSVPGLGWYRPAAVVAKAGVVVDRSLVEAVQR